MKDLLDKVAALAELQKKATPGPWRWEDNVLESSEPHRKEFTAFGTRYSNEVIKGERKVDAGDGEFMAAAGSLDYAALHAALATPSVSLLQEGAAARQLAELGRCHDELVRLPASRRLANDTDELMALQGLVARFSQQWRGAQPILQEALSALSQYQQERGGILQVLEKWVDVRPGELDDDAVPLFLEQLQLAGLQLAPILQPVAEADAALATFVQQAYAYKSTFRSLPEGYTHEDIDRLFEWANGADDLLRTAPKLLRAATPTPVAIEEGGGADDLNMVEYQIQCRKHGRSDWDDIAGGRFKDEDEARQRLNAVAFTWPGFDHRMLKQTTTMSVLATTPKQKATAPAKKEAHNG